MHGWCGSVQKCNGTMPLNKNEVKIVLEIQLFGLIQLLLYRRMETILAICENKIK